LSLSLVVGVVGVAGLGGGCDPSTSGGGGRRDGGTGDGGGGGDGDVDMAIPPFCEGLACNQVQCSGGVTTTLTGKVYAPNGTLPLYNAIVYVPNGIVEPFTPGVTCDQCGAISSGKPLVTALTGPDGAFRLENVPIGDNIPLVIQLGRWRRQVTIPHVDACVETPITDVNVTRLPRNQGEGDIPQMAIATGSADPFECLLLKLGIDSSEFTRYTGNGRVHYFRRNGRDLTGGSDPADTTLLATSATMKKYDVILLPCEGSPHFEATDMVGRLVDYLTSGGRVFTTHYSYSWLADPGNPPVTPANPLRATGSWNLDRPYDDNVLMTGIINTSFPKGMAFAQWLKNVEPTSTMGQLQISQWRYDLDNTTSLSQKWISGTRPTGTNPPNITQHMTFNMPLNPPYDDMGQPIQCGKVVYSDFHVSTNTLKASPTTFPGVCKTDTISAQEKALIFMLFDLSSCIQKDDQPPPIP
jgi:hypothetical protein